MKLMLSVVLLAIVAVVAVAGYATFKPPSEATAPIEATPVAQQPSSVAAPEAVFEIDASRSLDAEQKRRLRARFGPRVTAIAQDARSQARNRELAVERLRTRIDAALRPRKRRRATRATAASRERRLAAKRRRSASRTRC